MSPGGMQGKMKEPEVIPSVHSNPTLFCSSHPTFSFEIHKLCGAFWRQRGKRMGPFSAPSPWGGAQGSLTENLSPSPEAREGTTIPFLASDSLVSV